MIPVEKLKQAGVNVAGVIGERFLNEFSRAHFTYNSSVYSGHTLVDQFDDLIRIDFKIEDALEFDLDPISKNRFARIWKKHLIQKGASASLMARDGITPENLSLLAEHVTFTVSVYEGSNQSKERFTVTFDWALRARAGILLRDEGGGRRAIRLEPIKVALEKPLSIISEEVRKSIVGSGPAINKNNQLLANDEEWCIKVERLILLLLNGLLSTQMSNFIRSWELPRAIELFDGVSLQPDFLLIEDNALVVGAQVITAPVGISLLQSEITSFLSEFSRRYISEFHRISEQDLRSWSPDRSSTLSWIEEQRSLAEKKFTALAAGRNADSLNSPTVFLLTDSVLIDVLAKKFLSISESWSGSTELDRLVKGEVGWWFRVGGARGGVTNGGIEVHAQIDIGGKVQVCHFNFDPKDFGGWSCYGPCVNLSPHPDFGLSAYPIFTADGVYLTANLTTTGIRAAFCDWPDWANDILGWATSLLTQPLLDGLRLIVSYFFVRIAQYPHHFPGTALEWSPNMDTRPTSQGNYLVFAAEPSFN